MISSINTAHLAFQKIVEIGTEGKNSKVFKIRDLQLNAEFALKEVAKSDIKDINLYFNEARLLHSSSHPNVVEICYACEDDNQIYIVMPFYRHGSIKSLLHKRGLSVREIIKYSIDFLSGLHNIHSKRLIHFDIKPDNLLISDSDVVLLSDFGLSKAINYTGTSTPNKAYFKHMPPEGLTSRPQSVSWDIYQSGLTIYRMCCGNNEFYNQYNRHVVDGEIDYHSLKFDIRNGKFPNRSNFPAHIPLKLRKVIRKCLEVDPNNRYQSAIDVMNDIAKIDDCLDWHHSESDHERSWTMTNDDGTEYILAIDNSGASVAKKKTKTGNYTKITRFCKDQISDSELKEFFKSYP